MKAALLVLFGFLTVCAIGYGLLATIAAGMADGQVGLDEARFSSWILIGGVVALIAVIAIGWLT